MGYFKDTLKGISWMAALRFVTRALAILKIAVIARILLPYQFGLYGISLLVLGFLETLTETGINIFLIQEKDKTKEYLNSAWVVSIIRGFLIALLIIASSSFVVSFFASPAATYLLYLVALVAVVRGFINPAEINFQKNLQFNKLFIFTSFLFLVDTSVAITLAYLTKSEAAMIWSMVASAGVEVILSFIIFKERPTLAFELEKIKKVIERGKWITSAGVLSYTFQNLDNVVVGKILGTAPLGIYQQAYKISTIPVTEAEQIFNKVTFPIYVNISLERERLRKAFLRTTLTIIGLVIPVGIFVFVFAREIVLILLGEKWLAAVSVLKILAIFGILKAILNSAYSLFLAVKKQEIVTLVELISIIGLAIPLVPLTMKYGLVGTGISVIIGGVVSLPVIAYFLFKELNAK